MAAANQGLYNGFLSAGLLWGNSLGDAHASNGANIRIFFLLCVIIAGTFGAYTVKAKLFWIQAAPALVALFAVYSNK
jgi:putative membrane protein